MNDVLKQELRIKIKNDRQFMSKKNKSAYDSVIADNLIKSGILDRYNLILIYLSTEIEVSTKKIIDYCLENSIKCAVPRCVGKRKMNFYYYNQNTVFEISKFGIYEPADDKNNMVKNFDKTLCIVPGLSFDEKGYRLGYGGGFYDTFLADKTEIKKVGICYSRNITKNLPIEEFDIHVDMVITENNVEVYNG